MLTGARPATCRVTALARRLVTPGLVTLCVVTLAVITLGSGCGATGAVHATPTSDKIPVVASIDTWGSILSQLGGNRVREVSLVDSPAIDARRYRPSAADLAAIADARVLVVNGIGYDGWAAAAAAAHPSADRTVIDVGSVLTIGRGGNPNQSYSRAAVRRVVDVITRALQDAAPADRDYFATRRATFEKVALVPLDTLGTSIGQQYAGVAVGASSTVGQTLAQSLGLDLITPTTFLDAVESGGVPSPADLATIDDQIRGRRIRVYLDDVEHSSPAVAAQVRAAEKADVPVVTLSETVSPKDATFQAWQLQQLTALRTALMEKQ